MDGDDFRRNHFVESMATLMEQEGFPRMTGRVMGFMMVCDPAHQSSAQIAEALNASRGAISTATRALLQTGLIERRPMSGTRATFFEMKPDAMDKLVHAQQARFQIIRHVIEQGLGVIADRSDELQARLRGFHELLTFFEAEFPKLIARWDAAKKDPR